MQTSVRLADGQLRLNEPGGDRDQLRQGAARARQLVGRFSSRAGRLRDTRRRGRRRDRHRPDEACPSLRQRSRATRRAVTERPATVHPTSMAVRARAMTAARPPHDAGRHDHPRVRVGPLVARERAAAQAGAGVGTAHSRVARPGRPRTRRSLPRRGLRVGETMRLMACTPPGSSSAPSPRQTSTTTATLSRPRLPAVVSEGRELIRQLHRHDIGHRFAHAVRGGRHRRARRHGGDRTHGAPRRRVRRRARQRLPQGRPGAGGLSIRCPAGRAAPVEVAVPGYVPGPGLPGGRNQSRRRVRG
jgi:hypothetical protein